MQNIFIVLSAALELGMGKEDARKEHNLCARLGLAFCLNYEAVVVAGLCLFFVDVQWRRKVLQLEGNYTFETRVQVD